jgi:hypothetical protein
VAGTAGAAADAAGAADGAVWADAGENASNVEAAILAPANNFNRNIKPTLMYASFHP